MNFNKSIQQSCSMLAVRFIHIITTDQREIRAEQRVIDWIHCKTIIWQITLDSQVVNVFVHRGLSYKGLKYLIYCLQITKSCPTLKNVIFDSILLKNTTLPYQIKDMIFRVGQLLVACKP